MKLLKCILWVVAALLILLGILLISSLGLGIFLLVFDELVLTITAIILIITLINRKKKK